jgi:ABC-type branched-subunit amino acid transport system permease subunit
MRFRRIRGEWWIALGVPLVILLFIAYLTYLPERGATGFLHGIAWRPLEFFVLISLVFALFSLGLSLEFGYTGLINFGHVAFLTVGAYSAAIFFWIFKGTAGSLDRAPWPVALGWSFAIVLAGAAVATIFAIILGIPTLRLREDYLAIVTIAAAEILRTVLLNEAWIGNGAQGLFVAMPGSAWMLDSNTGFAHMLAPVNGILVGPEHAGLGLDPIYTFLILLALVAIAGGLALIQFLSRSPWGRVVRAIREDEELAAATGKNVFLYKLSSLILGSILASFAGVLYAWFTGYVSPDAFAPTITFYAWIILIIGGVGNHRGAILGAFVLWGVITAAASLPAVNFPFLQTFAEQGPQQILLIGIILILILLFRPQGALGNRFELAFAK